MMVKLKNFVYLLPPWFHYWPLKNDPIYIYYIGPIERQFSYIGGDIAALPCVQNVSGIMVVFLTCS